MNLNGKRRNDKKVLEFFVSERKFSYKMLV